MLKFILLNVVPGYNPDELTLYRIFIVPIVGSLSLIYMIMMFSVAGHCDVTVARNLFAEDGARHYFVTFLAMGVFVDSGYMLMASIDTIEFSAGYVVMMWVLNIVTIVLTGLVLAVSFTVRDLSRIGVGQAEGNAPEQMMSVGTTNGLQVAEKMAEMDDVFPLPADWEARRIGHYRVLYLNHNTKTSSWEDPRDLHAIQVAIEMNTFKMTTAGPRPVGSPSPSGAAAAAAATAAAATAAAATAAAAAAAACATTAEENAQALLKDVVIGKVIGSGMFGSVYSGVWKGTPVALKSKQKVDSNSALLQEVVMMKRLSHPNVVQVLGVFVDDDNHVYLAMEFVEQGSLQAILRSCDGADKPAATLARYCGDVCAGLAYLHQRSILHRDIALRNFLLSGSDHVKISDFGMTRLLEEGQLDLQSSRTTATAATGAPVRWSAAEVLLKGQRSSASDCYAMGIAIWEVFSYGTEPYFVIPPADIVDIVANDRQAAVLVRPSEMPVNVYEAILRCWSSSPQKRPTASELVYLFRGDDEPEDRKPKGKGKNEGNADISSGPTDEMAPPDDDSNKKERSHKSKKRSKKSNRSDGGQNDATAMSSSLSSQSGGPLSNSGEDNKE